MRWFGLIAVCYCVLMFLVIGIAPTLARLSPISEGYAASPDRQYQMAFSRDFPLPFGLNGPGAMPGEIRILDRSGRELDEEHVPDIRSVTDVHWERYTVNFVYASRGRWFRSTLDLEQ